MFRPIDTSSSSSNASSNVIIDSKPKARIGVLGVAYKENTHSTKNAMSLTVLNKFKANIAGVYDPLAVLPPEFSTVKLFSSASDCIMASDAIVVMTPWEEFSSLDFSYNVNVA